MGKRDDTKRETRQRISDVATRLFFVKGFDEVTVEEIAAAAHVSKMTVFNYFQRKEELILDREDDLRLLPFRQALQSRAAGRSAADALRALVRDLHAAKQPLCAVNAQFLKWWQVVLASPALRARLRELDEEAADALATELGGETPSADARLGAGMIVLAVRVAREEAFRLIEAGASMKKANATLLATLDHALERLDPLLDTEVGTGSSTQFRERTK